MVHCGFVCDAAVFRTASLQMSLRHWILSNVQAFIVLLVFVFIGILLNGLFSIESVSLPVVHSFSLFFIPQYL